MSLSIEGSGASLENTREMKRRLVEMGADVVGIADMTRYDREIVGIADGVAQTYPAAISFGLLIPKGVLETLTDGPTLFYLHHYRQVNYRLDTMAYLLAKEIEADGHRALPFAASQMIDWQRQLGHISHKHVACCGRGRVDRQEQPARTSAVRRPGAVQHGAHGREPCP